jgi:EAL domain-containing protein (putative c-di-GMP-specific phosphodiesterase class I)
VKSRKKSSPDLAVPAPLGGGASAAVEKLRLERLVTDAVTGLPLQPPADLERVAGIGIVFLQLGRFAGVESLYGWELYDRVLRLTTASLREDLDASALREIFLGLHFNGCDGFYLLFDVSERPVPRQTSLLEPEGRRLRLGVLRRLRQSLGRTAVDLMNVYVSVTSVADDPRVRPSRNLLRGLAEASRAVEAYQTGARVGRVETLKGILTGRKLRTVWQPVFSLKERAVLGHEALIRGPVGADLEMPDALFTAAREGDMLLELENLCLETIFSALPRAVRAGTLFVNASARLLTHPVFLDDRHLAEMKRAHSAVVIEVSEKEIVWNYPAFREVLERLRTAGFRFAIDDAGSGYSGLESILQLRPEFIKVADSIVRNVHADSIKREVLSGLLSLGRQIGAALIAEGIEQDEELRSLEALGIPYGQGFLLGRPAARVSSQAG